jgi:RNA polymerase sigma factor (sigma-70 family)
MRQAAQSHAIDQALDRLMRADKGRLLAALAYRLGDIALAEDMLQEACISALTHWGRAGLPASPQGWLLKVALRRAIDRFRARSRAAHHQQAMTLLAEEEAADSAAPEIPDDRLRMMFACCHPALDPKTRIALTLQVICGLSAAQIAAVFLDSDAAMGQRLSRAKAKIKAAGIGFAIPEAEAWPARLQSVLTAVYLLFTRGYAAGPQAGADLCEEALFLAQLLRELAPDDPEIQGALALLLITHARAGARGQGAMLKGQDRSLWDSTMLEEGVALVQRALQRGQVGPFQIKAAVAACHCAPDGPDWPQIAALLGALLRYEDTPVVRLSLAVAIGEVHGAAQGLALLAPLARELAGYGPYHAAHADLLARAGQTTQAALAYGQAIDLAESTMDKAYLRSKQAALPKDAPKKRPSKSSAKSNREVRNSKLLRSTT